MKCAICKNGETKNGTITVVLEKEKTTIVVRGVPAQICENCGEEYVASDTNGMLLKKASEAVTKGVDLELLRFAA